MAKEQNAPLLDGECAREFVLNGAEDGILWEQAFPATASGSAHAVPEVRVALDDCDNAFVATSFSFRDPSHVEVRKFFPDGVPAWTAPVEVSDQVEAPTLGALAVAPSGVVLVSSWYSSDRLFEFQSDGSRLTSATKPPLELGVNFLKRWDESWLAGGSGLGKINLPSGHLLGGYGVIAATHDSSYFMDAEPLDESRAVASRVRKTATQSPYRKDGEPSVSEDVFELAVVIRSMKAEAEDVILWSDERSTAPLNASLATRDESVWVAASWGGKGTCEESWIKKLEPDSWEWQPPRCLAFQRIFSSKENVVALALDLQNGEGQLVLLTLADDGQLLSEISVDALPPFLARAGSDRLDAVPFDAALHSDGTLTVGGYVVSDRGDGEFLTARLGPLQ